MSLVNKLIFFCNVFPNKVERMAPQKIYYYDLTFVLKGELVYRANGKEYVLKENNVMFLRPGTIRERDAGDQPAKYVSFNFLPSENIELNEFLKNIINDDIKKIVSILPQRLISSPFHSNDKAVSILDYILYELIDNTGFKTHNQHVLKILKYIDLNFSRNITLKDISEHINLTREYTANLFKKEMGITITEHINRSKMLIAKNLIDQGEMSLTDIALSLGYGNYSYFSKLFRKHHGASPIKRKNP